MDITLITGIITLVTALVSLSYIVIEKDLIPNFRKRKLLEKFTGKWKGDLHQKAEKGQENLPQQIAITMKRNKNKVKGKLTFVIENNSSGYLTEFNITGSIKHDRFLDLEYQNEDLNKLSFGSMVLEINPTNNELNGKLIGFGAKSKKIINGNIKVTRNV
ncbi:MAG: hypothetical protein AAF731_06145 [Bacteroidota bacterium]